MRVPPTVTKCVPGQVAGTGLAESREEGLQRSATAQTDQWPVLVWARGVSDPITVTSHPYPLVLGHSCEPAQLHVTEERPKSPQVQGHLCFVLMEAHAPPALPQCL